MTDFNAEQTAALEESATDFVLAASAGSGKTRVLMERYARRVESDGERAFDSTLAITFTDKAAGELWQRVRARVAANAATSPSMDRAWISTIHAMCSRLLRRHALDVGLDPRFSVGSAVELGVIRERVLESVAAKALSGSGPDSATRVLFRSYGTAGVSSLVVEISEHIRSRGLAAGEIATCEPLDVDRVRSMLEKLRVLIHDYSDLPESQTNRGNLSQLTHLVETCSAWAEGSVPDAELFQASLDFRQIRRGQAKEAAEEALRVADDLRLSVAQEMVRPYEAALLGMVADFAHEYAAAKRSAGLVDFQDLQEFVVDLLETHPELADRYAQQFSSVMIDEFQDTDALQVRLIDRLAPDGFLAVGDERQSIYRFRQADVDIFRQRMAQAAASRTLRTNYRSHPALVACFNEVFGNHPFWPDDFLRLETERTEPASQCRVTAILIDSKACGADKDADEAVILAEHVRALLEEGAEAGDIVILLRAMPAAETFAGALRDAGVEVFVASGGTYFDRAEVIDLEMLLRLVANTRDTEALLHVLAGPLGALSDNALGRIRMRADSAGMWAACRELDALELEEADLERLSRVVSTVEWFRAESGRAGLADTIHEACERLEYDLTLFARGSDGARAWANVLKLARIAQEYEHDSPGDPRTFLEHLRRKRELEGRESLATFASEDVGAVRIMSIHAAKGLEFPITIVANLGRGRRSAGNAVLSTAAGEVFLGMRLPVSSDGAERIETLGHRRAVEAERAADLAEERRLFYVACTRAQDRLVLCGRTDFAQEAECDRLVGWVRQSLGFEAAGSISEGEMALGASCVRVLTPAPSACGPVGLVRPKADDRALEIAQRGGATSPGEAPPQIERVSYSGLNLHRTCPYRYYVTNIARLGSRSPNTTGNDAAVALGVAVHAVLQITYGFELPPMGRVNEICRFAGVPREEWADVVALAGAYLDSDVARRVASADRVAREMPFSVPFGETLLVGSMDLIAWEGSTALIVDYKAGGAERAVDAEAHRMQAECYAVAAFALGASAAEVLFVHLRKGNETTVFTYAASSSEELRVKIDEHIAELRSGTFRPLDRYSAFACPECPALGNLCPVSAPGRKPAV